MKANLAKTAADAGEVLSRDMPLRHPLKPIVGLLGELVEKFTAIEWHVEQIEEDAALTPLLDKLSQEKQHIEELKAEAESLLASRQTQALAALFVDQLHKSANLLDQAGTGSTTQASAGIDAVLEGLSDGFTQDQLIDRLGKVATLLDAEGHAEAAALIDTIIKDAAELPTIPGRWETREELYNAAAHNRDSMWEQTKAEVAENRKEHHVETHRGTAPSLSTRYSPELPGVSVMPVSDGVYQDPVTRKVYDFRNGYTLNGVNVPGGSVRHQTPNMNQYSNISRMFDSRSDKNRRRASAETPLSKVAIKGDPFSGGFSEDTKDLPEHFGEEKEVVKPAKSTTQYSPEEIDAMREWISSLSWREAELDPEDFAADLTDEEVVNGIKRHYDGGMKQFLADVDI